jgi:hypothetical protein
MRISREHVPAPRTENPSVSAQHQAGLDNLHTLRFDLYLNGKVVMSQRFNPSSSEMFKSGNRRRESVKKILEKIARGITTSVSLEQTIMHAIETGKVSKPNEQTHTNRPRKST